MSRETAPFDRRTLLRGALATAALAPLSGALAACGGSSSSGAAATKTATNPFGLAKSSSVEAVIFNGGYGYDYVKFAADQVKKQKDFSGVTIKVSPSTQIAQQLQPRFVGGTPPDLIDNRAPFGDTTIGLGDGLSAGAVSSITAAYIAQLLTLGAAQRLRDAGEVPPLYISANIPGGDTHNDALKARYGERIAGHA